MTLRRLPIIVVLAAGFSALPGQALEITGTVTISGAAASGVGVYGANADCTPTNGAGAYACTVANGWSGSIAPRRVGVRFQAVGDPYAPAARTFTSLVANQAGVDFAGTPNPSARSERAIYRAGTNQFFLDYDQNSSPEAIVRFGTIGDLPLVADVNGDGLSDLVVYRSGTWFTSTNRNGTADQIYGFGGVAGDIPLLADLSGDGRADLIIFRGGTWYVSTGRNGVADRIYHFGQAGDIPLAGDMDGDGLADLVIFRNGQWFVDTTRSGRVSQQFGFGGVAGERPQLFDHDGDGRLDVAVVRNGLWYICTSRDGALAALVGYGTSGDLPVAGSFNTANTLFVRAGGSCTDSCSAANPYGSIGEAWRDASAGTVIRIGAGTYAENLVFSYPGNQYAPGEFGKNHVAFFGVGRQAVRVSPASGDALYLQGASGYLFRGMSFQSSGASGRGVVLTGGPGDASALPSFPAAHAEFANVAFGPNAHHNLLLTGASWVTAFDSNADSSQFKQGVSLWDNPLLIADNLSASNNGWGVAPIPLPDAGKGLEMMRNAEARINRSRFIDNLTFGAIAINNSRLIMSKSTVSGAKYTGIQICGASSPDTTRSTLTQNWIAGNGTAKPAGFPNGFNGLEYYTTCVGNQQVSSNAIVGNSYNGIFLGSGSATISGNTFTGNMIGLSLYANDQSMGGEPASAADTDVVVTANTFDANRADGIFAERFAATGTPRRLIAQVGGAPAQGLANQIKNHTVQPEIGFAYGISCSNLLAADFACATGQNVFSGNSTDIEGTCPASCVP